MQLDKRIIVMAINQVPIIKERRDSLLMINKHEQINVNVKTKAEEKHFETKQKKILFNSITDVLRLFKSFVVVVRL